MTAPDGNSPSFDRGLWEGDKMVRGELTRLLKQGTSEFDPLKAFLKGSNVENTLPCETHGMVGGSKM
jgi:hypothetical protein